MLPYATKAQSTKDNSDSLVETAKRLDQEGKFVEARESYLKIAQTNPSLQKWAYSRIGNLYMRSWKICLQEYGDPIKDKTPYFAAYDMFAKAEDEQGMARAKSTFPKKSDIICGPRLGTSREIEVGCWIGGTTTIRFRDE